MKPNEALAQIEQIRLHIARNEFFRGVRATPVAFSGFVAVIVACIQAISVVDPARNVSAYLLLWLSAALVSVIAASVGMIIRYVSPQCPLDRETTVLALERFVPCLAAGGLVTLVLYAFVPEGLWMLPGLWAIFYSLGIFACYRLLPPAIFWVGAYYLSAGLCCLIIARGAGALSPLAMGLTFGPGQFLAAAVLYWTLERNTPDA